LQANQTWLHQKLKTFYSAENAAKQEVTVEADGRRYRIDVLNEQTSIAYEIQLSNFGKQFSDKVKRLLGAHIKVIIVYPIPIKEQITWLNKGEISRSRIVTKRNDTYSLFDELVHFKAKFLPDQIGFDVLLTEEAIWKEFIGFRGRTRRPRYRQIQRDLLRVRETHQFRKRADFINLLPDSLPPIFTNRDLAEKLVIQGGERRRRRIVGRMTYSLCSLGILSRVGKKKRAHEFAIRNSLSND
jgi:hypothetical protein